MCLCSSAALQRADACGLGAGPEASSIAASLQHSHSCSPQQHVPAPTCKPSSKPAFPFPVVIQPLSAAVVMQRMAAAFGKPRSERLAAVLAQTAVAKPRTLAWALAVIDGTYEDLAVSVCHATAPDVLPMC